VPSGHNTVRGDVLPAGHAYPASHCPVQLGDASALAFPNLPGPQLLHKDAPAPLYCPAGHGVDVGELEPAGHT
jgi:hypothetical protein